MTEVPSRALPGQRRRDLWSGSVVDADVHASPPSMAVLFALSRRGMVPTYH